MERACVICDYTITNPICTDCLENEVLCWVADHNERMAKNLINFSKIFPHNLEQDSKCITCGNKMNVCPHCFCKEVGETFNNELLKNTFVETFNFDLT
jgi:hypothetical protein